MKSFSILRTNVGLTSNVKVMVDSNYGLYLESIASIPELDITRLKKMQFNKLNFYDELVPYFFRNIPVDIAFEVKWDNDRNLMSNDFKDQYDDIYQMGARNIVNNKNYKEEYEYFAPLYIFKHNIPDYFVIFRIDGPGLDKLDRLNFRELFLTKFKAVKVFDLTRKTELGEWIDRNFRGNKSFPTKSLDIDFRNLEFTKWYGIDYESGGYTSKSRFMDESLEDENTLFDFEKLFYDGYRVNKLVYPQIINFNFLFDDNPATPDRLRKWSLNRYAGFYIEKMELVDKITPFKTPELKSGVQILDGNVLSHESGDPFVRGFDDDNTMWIEYLGDFFKVEKFQEFGQKGMISNRDSRKISTEEYKNPTITKYRIISEIDLSGEQEFLNTKKFKIENSVLLNEDLSPIQIEGFSLSDIHLIQIGDRYHNLISENGEIKIFTDWGFNLREDFRFEYFINSPDPEYYNFIDLKSDPFSFSIFRLKFSEIKDFDTQIVESNMSKFEYERLTSLTKTEEPKMYTNDLRSRIVPTPLNDYIYNGQVENIPASSDYTANLETFRIQDGDLTDLWRKNPIHCRWGYQNSLGSSDYPYLLNNNEIHDSWNRTVNARLLYPVRSSRNLDYFYTINSGNSNYLWHSLHVEKNIDGQQDASFRFELDKYLNRHTIEFEGETYTYSLDYFDYLFNSQVDFLGGGVKMNSKKFSLFESGDLAEPNTTVFRGLKFKIFEVDSIKSSFDNVNQVNVKTSNLFEDWKFSILLSNNDSGLDDSGDIYNIGNWGYFLDNVPINNQVGFITSTQSPPDNIEIGDVVTIKQKSNLNGFYNRQANVTDVGILATFSGEPYYGFLTDIPWNPNTFGNNGYWRVMMQWSPIKKWENGKLYLAGEIVIWDDILFEVMFNNIIKDPSQNPQTSTQVYQYYSGESPFWNPEETYGQGDWVYRDGNFYYYDNSGSANFWSPTFSYSLNDVVIYKNDFYSSRVGQNSGNRPRKKSPMVDISSYRLFWNHINDSPSPRWKLVPIWNPVLEYDINQYVVYRETLYRSLSDVIVGVNPEQSPDWSRIYSFVPDTNFNYGTQSNPFLKLNESFYLCTFNKDFTLDNGLTVYINKKWKHVFINIGINDNTTMDVDNKERDHLYSLFNSRLTAANFIKQINSLDSKYGFSDLTTYVVIDENGVVSKYNLDNNLDRLPYILSCEEPDEFELNNRTLRFIPATIDKNILKPNFILKNGNIDNLLKINYYNDIPLGCEIIKNLDRDINQVNYNKLSDISLGGISNLRKRGSSETSRPMFRHSGPYMPIFYEIDLFDKKACEFEDLFSIEYKSEVSESIGNIDQTFNTGSGFDAEPVRLQIDEIDRKITLIGNFETYQGLTCGSPDPGGGVCRIDLDGTPDFDFINNIGIGMTGGNVRGLCLQSDKKILVGGQFTHFNGLTFSALIRLNYDGTVDESFNQGFEMIDISPNGIRSVYEILQQEDGRIIVAGNFNLYRGMTVSSGIVRILQNGEIDPDFNAGLGITFPPPDPPGRAIYSAFLQEDGKILCGGIFTGWDGATVSNIVRLNQDGSLDQTFEPNVNGYGTNTNGIILGINQSQDGKIYLGGGFNQFNGFTYRKIVRLNIDGTIDQTFTSPFGVTNSIGSIHFQNNGKIVLGGSSLTNTSTTTGIRLNLDGSIDQTFTASFTPNGGSRSYVDSIGRILFIGGSFTEVNGSSASRIVRFDVEYELTKSSSVSECLKYKFNENLTNFGIIKGRVISKVNRRLNLLKLRKLENYNSIYPMLDEFGYTSKDFFIFKSTWDYNYYLECGKNTQVLAAESPLVSQDGTIPPQLFTPSENSNDSSPTTPLGGIVGVGGVLIANPETRPGPITGGGNVVIGDVIGLPISPSTPPPVNPEIQDL